MTEEKSLTLVVQEKTLGTLVTNAKQIRELVAQKIEEYSVDNYPGDEKQAAKDKAELNNAAKRLNSARIELEKEFMSPFNEFKEIVNDTVSLINTASSKLDAIVKEKERREKAEKKAKVTEMWNTKKFTLVPLEKVYNTKWENKTYKFSAIESDIDGIISQIESDLNALDAFGEDTAQLKGLYLSTLNLQTALKKGAELKSNRERLAARQAEEERRRAEEAARKAEEEARLAREKAERGQENAATEEPSDSEETVLSNEAARERARAIRESLAKNAGETPAAPELPKEAASEKKYIFSVISKDPVLARTEEIAESIGMTSIPSLTLKATVAQIEQFKRQFESLGFTYLRMPPITLLEIKK